MFLLVDWQTAPCKVHSPYSVLIVFQTFCSIRLGRLYLFEIYFECFLLFSLEGLLVPIRVPIRSRGIGKMIVEFFSPDIELKVCNKRNNKFYIKRVKFVSSLHWLNLAFLYAVFVHWSILATELNFSPLYPILMLWALRQFFSCSNTMFLRISHSH